MRLDSATQPVDQRLIHILIVIGDVETHDALPREGLAELLLEAIQVSLLHDKDHVSPAKMPRRYANAGALLGPNRAHLVPVCPVEDRLRRQAAKAILATHKENLHQ